MIAALLALALALPPSLPQDSVYLLEAKSFVDQAGNTSSLAAHRGRPVLLAMFYATCPSACPRLIADVQRALAALSDAERSEVRVLLVSLDPKRDTPAVLAGVIETRGLDAQRTTLLTGSPADTRRLAAVLGVKYREDGQGAIDHTSRMVVLDAEGRIAVTMDGLGGSVGTTVDMLRRLLVR